MINREARKTGLISLIKPGSFFLSLCFSWSLMCALNPYSRASRDVKKNILIGDTRFRSIHSNGDFLPGLTKGDIKILQKQGHTSIYTEDSINSIIMWPISRYKQDYALEYNKILLKHIISKFAK